MAVLRASFGLSPLPDRLPRVHDSDVSVINAASLLPGLVAVERGTGRAGQVLTTRPISKLWIHSGARSRNWMAMLNATNDAKAALISEFSNTIPCTDALRLWQTADAVCFDVDSTVCMDEGIDELANFCGAGEAVAAWTSRAMGGSVRFEDALAARLDLIRPSLSDLKNFLASKPPKLSPGIQDLVKRLHARGTNVYLISGGFRHMIEPVAALLQITKENIYANKLLFDENGKYAGFDKEEPTSCSGGKAVAIAQIKEKNKYQRLVMIGDGATDLEAKMPGGADVFICFGGVQVRPAVAAGADWFILSFEDLIQTLDKPGDNSK
ncbi:hypothetical protein O6H91_10G103400 [Diphasiastrum complanatum]|uniref:Uncharacterized protein n=1 Tax=Diphasiastrum complanatum TaxID=34168 RepID=A0ACC2CK57_DIPCM|nr:hypothetical protein O6H91_10G103400 [Diphasiastrum complanatum]